MLEYVVGAQGVDRAGGERQPIDAAAGLDIGVPDAKFVAAQWVRGEVDTAEANHWILGGHSERAAHKGTDERGVPLWIWNAHHTLFDAESLRAAVAEFFVVEELFTYDIRNLRVYARKP